MVLLALSIVIIGYKVTQKLNEKTVDTVITDLKSLNWKDLNNTVGVLSSQDFKQALKNIQGLNVDQVNNVIGDVQDSWGDIKKGLEKFDSLNVDDITKTIKQGMQEFESVGSKIKGLDVGKLNTVIGDVQGSWSDIQNGLKTVNMISNDLDDNTITSFKNIINSPSVQTISQNLCDPINIPIKAGILGKFPWPVGPVPKTASTIPIKLPGCSSKTNFDFEDEYDFY